MSKHFLTAEKGQEDSGPASYRPTALLHLDQEVLTETLYQAEKACSGDNPSGSDWVYPS